MKYDETWMNWQFNILVFQGYNHSTKWSFNEMSWIQLQDACSHMHTAGTNFLQSY